MAGRTGVTVRSATAPEVCAALRNHVIDVVLDGAQEQMIGPDARRIVAAVEHPQAIRDRPEVKFPRNTVSELLAARPTPDVDDAVALRQSICGPQPARRRLVHLRPEAGSQRTGPGGYVARMAAVLPGGAPSGHGCAALRTRGIGAKALTGMLAGSRAVGPLPVADSRRFEREGGAALGTGQRNARRILSRHQVTPGVSPGWLPPCRGTLRSSIVPDWGSR